MNHLQMNRITLLLLVLSTLKKEKLYTLDIWLVRLFFPHAIEFAYTSGIHDLQESFLGA